MKKNRVITLVLIFTLLMSTMSFASVDYNKLGTGTLNTTVSTEITIESNFDVEDIEHMSLVEVKTRTNVNASFKMNEEKDGVKLTITPVKNFEADKNYELKIFTIDNQFKYSFTTSEYVNFKNYPIVRNYYEKKNDDGGTTWEDKYYYRVEVPANPSKGFHFPYFLSIPVAMGRNEDGNAGPIGSIIPTDEILSTEYSNYLIVEPNNTGSLSHSNYAEQVLEGAVYAGNFADRIAIDLGMPHLMPAFPRPSGKDARYYTHLLDDESLFMTQEESDDIGIGNLTRLDEQLEAMIEDAKEQFKANDITLEEKVVLAGYSASSKFVNRYSMLNPEDVEIVIGGTIQTAPMVPYEEFNNNELNYPLGINDYKERFGKSFSHDDYKQIKQFWFVGGDDKNDVVRYYDSFSKDEASIIYANYGKDLTARWDNIENLYNEYGSKVIMHTYKNIKHETNAITERDCRNFIINNLGKDFIPIVPSVSGR